MGRRINIEWHFERPKGVLRSLISAGILLIGLSLPAAASYLPFNTNVNMKVGIGTSTPQGAFVVTNGNVGIGTWAPGGALIVMNGNVGIGTSTPNNILAIQARSGQSNDFSVTDSSGNPLLYTGLNGNGAAFFGVNTSAADYESFGVLTYGSSYSASFNPGAMYLQDSFGGPVKFIIKENYFAAPAELEMGAGEFGSQGYGIIGTATNSLLRFETDNTVQAVIDTLGNVGIGTMIPYNTLSVAGGAAIGSAAYAGVAGPPNGLIVQGNVGIGSLSPGQALDVQGTVRMKGFTLNLNPNAGYVLVGNGVGVGTWMPASTLLTSGGSGTNYWVNDTGNVGIGTSYNVGIGTISQINTLNILGNVGIGTFSYDPYLKNKAPNGGMIIYGNVGIGTWLPAAGLDAESSAANGFAIYGNSSTAGGTGVAGNDSSSGTGVFGTSNTGIAVLAQSSSATLYALEAQNFGGGPSAFFQSGSNAAGALPTLILEQFSTSTADLFQAQNASGISLVNITSVGNVGIGTFAPNGKLIVSGGNVGIGSLAPGTALDVNGTVRMTGLTLTGNGAGSGNVLVTNGVGVGTWMPASTLTSGGGTNYWLNDTTGNVGISTIYAVGIGTAFVGGTGEAALSVMNGNVGIGTWKPGAALDVEAGGNTYFGGNVGIGSSAPGETLDVQGVIRTTNFNLSTNPTSGFVLTTDGFGNGTWQSLSSNSGWTVSGNNVYETDSGNVGIGTSSVTQGALVVTNGNVGIGTWAPIVPLQIVGVGTLSPNGGGMVITNGNVGIGTVNPGAPLFVNGGTIVSYNPLEATGEGIVTYVGNGKAINMQAGTANGNILYDNTGGFSFQSEARAQVITGTSSSSNITMFIDTNGNVGIGTSQSVLGGLIVQNGDVGIGTNFPQTAMVVMGNQGIGTWTAKGGNLIVNGGGNVGIGSAWPGTMLDVQGTARALGEIINGNVGIGTSALQTAFAVDNGNVGIGTWTASSGLQLKESFAVYRVGTGISATSAGQTIIGVTNTSAARTITLATADVVPGRVIIIKDETGGAAANNITVNTQGGQTIDGVSTVTITANYGVLRVYSDGNNWFTF
jgi:hypothetical protein